MEITVREAADALSVTRTTLTRWYLQTPDQNAAPPYMGLDSEVLCENIGLDHRFLLAFLVGYDICLLHKEIQALFKRNYFWVNHYVKPVPICCPAYLGKRGLMRYSYRRVAPVLAKFLEEKRGKNRTPAHGGGTILPAPDLVPSPVWTFRSALLTEGRRLPRSRRTRLEHGGGSSLPILGGRDRGEG